LLVELQVFDRDPVPPEAVGDALADAYNALHDEELSLFTLSTAG